LSGLFEKGGFMLKQVGLLLLCPWLAIFSSLVSAEQAFFQQSFGDFSEELEIAREEGKKGIFIFFEMDECPFCHRMKTTILNQPDVIDYYARYFRRFQIDIEGDVEMTDFQGNVTSQKDFAFKQHRVRATPVMAFFDLSGKRVVRYTGATSSVQEFLWLGEYVVSEAYKKTSFTRYKREKRKSGQ